MSHTSDRFKIRTFGFLFIQVVSYSVFIFIIYSQKRFFLQCRCTTIYKLLSKIYTVTEKAVIVNLLSGNWQ